MNKVNARALATSYSFQSGSEVTRIEYAGGNLSIHVRGCGNEPSLVVEFNDTLGYRVLDERDLMEYWPVCSTPNGWLFEVTSGGWLTQEGQRPGSCLVPMNPEAKEFLITGEDDCVSVLSSEEPTVREHAL